MSENKMATKADLQRMYNKILPYLGGTAEAGFTPVGTVIAVMGNSAPANYLACNGQVVNIADYPVLADYFEAQFSAKNYFGGDGTTTFAVPDLRGEFLRGTGINSHADGGNGANVGVHQGGTALPEYFIYTNGSLYSKRMNNADSNFISGEDKSLSGEANVNYSSLFNPNQNYADIASSVYKRYVRPTNTSVLYCIATHNIFINPELQYSTQEQVVGTWIDGKPLYQRTIRIDNPTVDVNNQFYVNFSNVQIDTPTAINAYYANTGDGVLRTLEKHSKISAFGVQRNTSPVPNSFYIQATESGTYSITIFATIQYTKTTD